MNSPESAAEAFSPNELTEVRNFLFNSYLQAAHGLPSAMPRKPKEQVDPELARLKKIRKRPPTAAALTDEDIRQLAEAANSSFGTDFAAAREGSLQKALGVPVHSQEPGTTNPLTVGQILLKNLLKHLCGNAALKKSNVFTISAASLGGLLSVLGISPLLAPVAVWFALRLRDVGLPVLCDAAKEYLTQKGIPVE